MPGSPRTARHQQISTPAGAEYYDSRDGWASAPAGVLDQAVGLARMTHGTAMFTTRTASNGKGLNAVGALQMLDQIRAISGSTAPIRGCSRAGRRGIARIASSRWPLSQNSGGQDLTIWRGQQVETFKWAWRVPIHQGHGCSSEQAYRPRSRAPSEHKEPFTGQQHATRQH